MEQPLLLLVNRTISIMVLPLEYDTSLKELTSTL